MGTFTTILVALILVIVCIMIGWESCCRFYIDGEPLGSGEVEVESTGETGKLCAYEEGRIVDSGEDFSLVEVRREGKVEYVRAPHVGEIGETAIVFYGLTKKEE